MNPKEPIINDQQSASSNSSFPFDSLENSSESAESVENLTKIIEINENNILKEESNFDDSIPRYSFTASERSQAMSMVAVGALLANFPIVVLINWHGKIIYLFWMKIDLNSRPPNPICIAWPHWRFCDCHYSILPQPRILLVFGCSFPSRSGFCRRYGHFWSFSGKLD